MYVHEYIYMCVCVCVCIYIHVYGFTQPLRQGEDVKQGQFLSGVNLVGI